MATKPYKKISEKTENYYDLKKDAVNELVEALNASPDEITNSKDERLEEKSEHNPYKLDGLAKIPTWIKAFFIKFWFAGAICYFFMWGLGIYITNSENMFLLVGIATGLLTDILLNNAMLAFESPKKEYHPYMLVPYSTKKLWTLFINIPVGIIEVLIITFIYSGINELISKAQGLPENSIPFGVEPITYGLFYLIVNMSIVGIKDLIVWIVKRKSSGK